MWLDFKWSVPTIVLFNSGYQKRLVWNWSRTLVILSLIPKHVCHTIIISSRLLPLNYILRSFNDCCQIVRAYHIQGVFSLFLLRTIQYLNRTLSVLVTSFHPRSMREIVSYSDFLKVASDFLQKPHFLKIGIFKLLFISLQTQAYFFPLSQYFVSQTLFFVSSPGVSISHAVLTLTQIVGSSCGRMTIYSTILTYWNPVIC